MKTKNETSYLEQERATLRWWLFNRKAEGHLDAYLGPYIREQRWGASGVFRVLVDRPRSLWNGPTELVACTWGRGHQSRATAKANAEILLGEVKVALAKAKCPNCGRAVSYNDAKNESGLTFCPGCKCRLIWSMPLGRPDSAFWTATRSEWDASKKAFRSVRS